MKAIDTDPTFLRQLGKITAHSYDQSITHIEAEMKGVIPELMETLTEDGPYGYTITPEVLADGGVKLPVISTREGIEEAYKMIRGRSDLLAVNPLTEIRGTWYTFQDAISYGQLKGTDQRGAHETLGLFPSSTGQGITGELVWVRVPRSVLGGGDLRLTRSAEEMHLREQVFQQHDRFLQALLMGDLDGVLGTIHDRAVVRSTRLCRGHRDPDLSGRFEGPCRLFRRLLRQVRGGLGGAAVSRRRGLVRFAEVRVTAEVKSGSSAGQSVAFHTAEFHVPAKDGRFIARIGHGTDLA